MFRIKICGITNVEDGLRVVEAGADAVGLNFYTKSPRYVEPETARQIIDALPVGTVKVGLFVNASKEYVCGTCEALTLELIQLHGDEPPEFLAELGTRPVMRAFRVGPSGLRPVTGYLQRCRRLECMPRMVLVDSLATGAYGGSGKLTDWSALERYPTQPTFPPLVLAGGLTPENVAQAIRTVGPAAVDTASGVESSPGRKDPAAVEAFVRAAREAFNNV